MQSMSFASTARKVTAFAAAAAALLALGACGNSNNGAKSTSEPQEGVPTNYTGSFPMPDPGKAYNNPKDRGELKQGGTLTLPITEIGPNWNAIDVNGNTVYMSGLWRFYMPCIWEYPADGSLENIKPNTNYVTKVEQTSDSPETVVFTINDKASWNDHLKGLMDLCKKEGVRVIFVQPEFDRRNAEIIAKQTGTRVISINPLSYDWEEEMLNVARSLRGEPGY